MKSKGRPKGSEKDDSKALNAMADMIHADPALKPTTALRRYNPKAGEAEIRRLQVKWKERSETLLAAAATRAVEKRRHAVSASMPAARRDLGAVAEAVRAAAEIYNSPGMRAMREFQNSPAARAIWEFQNSPTMRAISEAQNSPAMRAIRDFHDSPTARAVNEAQKKMNRLPGGW